MFTITKINNIRLLKRSENYKIDMQILFETDKHHAFLDELGINHSRLKDEQRVLFMLSENGPTPISRLNKKRLEIDWDSASVELIAKLVFDMYLAFNNSFLDELRDQLLSLIREDVRFEEHRLSMLVMFG